MKRRSTIHLRGQDARDFMKAIRESVGEGEASEGKKHVPLIMAMNAEREKLLAVADAADVVMHHYADSLFHENSFGKMVDAMEPLRQALINAGYGLPKNEVPDASL